MSPSLTAAGRLSAGARVSLYGACFLVAAGIGSFAFSAYKAGVGGWELAFPVAHALTALLLGVLAVLRPSVSLLQLVVTEALLIAPAYGAVWMRHARLVELGADFVPFLGMKLIVLGLAVVVPGPVWLHLAWIAGYAGLAVVMWFHFDLGAHLGPATADEPWFTIVFFIVSVGLLLFRWRNEALERRLFAAEARSRVFASVARLFLRLRDETNTPLQNVEIAAGLLALRHPEERETVGRIQAAVARLKTARGSLTRYEHLVDWNGRETGADPELERLLAELESEVKAG